MADPDKQPEETATGGRRTTHRSPKAPFIPLEKAIERARQLFDSEGKHAARIDTVAPHWGYKPKSSGTLQTVGALRYFGLISVDEGKGKTGVARTIQLTALAIRILLDKRTNERVAAVREAALSPSLYQELWEKWNQGLPSEENATSQLIVDLAFNHKTAPGVFRAYKDTLEYAGLLESGSDEPEGQDELAEDPPPDGENREEQEGEELPFKQEKAAPLLKGEHEHLRMRLVGDRWVRVLFGGAPPTRDEITKLIAMLELTKDQYPESGGD